MVKTISVLAIVMLLLFVAVPSPASDKGRAYFDFGVFALEEGDLKGAEMNFKRSLMLSPDIALTHHYLGKTYLQMGKYNESMVHLTRARELDPNLSGLSYDIAYLSYEMKDYAKAAGQFEAVINEDKKNVLAHYYCGISLFKLKQYRRAQSYFMVASEMSPTIKTNGYYYAGICALEMGDYDRALERLEYVRQYTDSETLRSHAVKWLSAIESEKKKMKRYSLYLKFGGGFDSNVALDPLDENIASDKDDYFLQVYFSGKYNLINRQHAVLGAGYSHYQTWYKDLDEYDLTGSIGSFYGRLKRGTFTFGFTYFPHYYWLDRDRYLRRHQLMPEVTWRAGRHIVVRVLYSYYDNEYFQDDGRDGHTHEPVLTGYYFFGKQKGYLYGEVGYEDNSTDDSDREYHQLKLRAGFSINLIDQLNMNISGRYTAKDYDHEDSQYLDRRSDDKFYGSIALSAPLYYDWLIGMLEYNYTKNNSNIDAYEYRKHIVMLSLAVKF